MGYYKRGKLKGHPAQKEIPQAFLVHFLVSDVPKADHAIFPYGVTSYKGVSLRGL